MRKPIKNTDLYVTWELHSEPIYLNYFKETNTINFETGVCIISEVSVEALLEAADIIKEYKALD